MPGDKLTERRANRRLGEKIDVYAVEQRLREGFADIAEGGATGVSGRKLG